MAADLQTQGFESVQWYLEGISAWAGTQCICGIIHSKKCTVAYNYFKRAGKPRNGCKWYVKSHRSTKCIIKRNDTWNAPAGTCSRKNKQLSQSGRCILMPDKWHDRPGDKRVVQSPALWLISNLNIICIWQFHCPLVRLQMAAHPATEVPLTVADQSRVESNQSTNQNTFRAQDVTGPQNTHGPN